MRLQRVELPNHLWGEDIVDGTWTPHLRQDAEAWAAEHSMSYRLMTFQRMIDHPQQPDTLLLTEVCHLVARSPKAAKAFQEKWGGELKPKPDLMSSR